MIKDQLSWEEFQNSPKNKKINKVEPFNRLIAHSKIYRRNFWIRCTISGYLIVITKDYLPSLVPLKLKI